MCEVKNGITLPSFLMTHVHVKHFGWCHETQFVKFSRVYLYNAMSSPQDRSRRFTLYSLSDLFSRTPSRLLWGVFIHVAINARSLFVHKYPPLSLVVQLSNLEHCRVKEFAQDSTQQRRIRTRVLLVQNPNL